MVDLGFVTMFNNINFILVYYLANFNASFTALSVTDG